MAEGLTGGGTDGVAVLDKGKSRIPGGQALDGPRAIQNSAQLKT